MDHDLLKQARYTCPWCWELIETTIDLSAGSQTFIEDCQVCCNPIEISFTTRGQEIDQMTVNRVS